MGLLVNGQWQDKWYDTNKSKGEFIREQSQFRNWITPNGEAGPTGEAGFTAEADRYHLYVSLACPWAHRTLIFRHLKQLDDIISVSVVSPYMMADGWTYDQEQLSSGDAINGAKFHHEIYTQENPNYTGRVTVPVLWDKKQNRIVNNESADIIRMLNSAFNHITGNTLDFYPKQLQAAINELNDEIYENVNNGVYRAGFATSQEAYEKAYHRLFNQLDILEERLTEQRYLFGENQTEADWRLFTTLIRFDAVYHGHFKCNKQRIEDYPNLSKYIRDLYQTAKVADTVDFHHIKQHYYYSHATINPTRVVPLGPEINYQEPAINKNNEVPAAHNESSLEIHTKQAS